MPDQPEPAPLTRPADVHRRLVELYPELLATGEFDAGLALIDPDVVDHRGGTDGDHRGRVVEHWAVMDATAVRHQLAPAGPADQ